MRLVGKSSPRQEEIRGVEGAGFDGMEVYLEREHLDTYERSCEALRETDLDIVSVHTPHVAKEEQGYIEDASRLAAEFDARLVFHSSLIHVRDALEMGEGLEYEDVAYENDFGYSRPAVENLILEQGYDLVLDSAHLYVASDSFYDDFEALLEEASHVHLCDATVTRDGLPLEEGEIDVERMVTLLEGSSYVDADRPVVLEVMPPHQKAGKKLVEDIIGD
jgi:sugar phosphate isomerase/epimerase